MSLVGDVLVAILPPDGYVVDFDNPQRNSVGATYVVSGLGMCLALFFLLQRLYVKAFIRNNFGIDDGSFIEGWMGVHGWEIPFDKFQTAVFVRISSLRADVLSTNPSVSQWATYINSIVYTVPTCLSKIVILLFLLELNRGQAWYRWTVFVTIFVVAGSSISIFFASVFPCTPFRKSWDITLAADVGSCIDRPAMFQATAGLGVATDILIIAIPIPMVAKLHLSNKKKAALLGLFFIGSAYDSLFKFGVTHLLNSLHRTVITSMVRLALLISQLDAVDTTWGGGPIHVWMYVASSYFFFTPLTRNDSCVEANLLIMCACLSTLRHFVKTVAPRLLSSKTGTSTGKSKTGISSNHELRTIGGGTGGRSANRAPYTQFDEPFSTTAHAEAGLWPREGKAGSIDGKASNDDGGSDKGILQTTTTEVYYSDARRA